MTFVAVQLMLFVAALAQSVLPAVAVLGHAKIPFLLAVVLYYALHHGRAVMLTAALVGGLAQDSLGFTPLGCTACCFCLAGLSVQGVRDLLVRDSALTAAALTALFAFLIMPATWLFLAFGEFGRAPEMGLPPRIVWLRAAGAALLAPAASVSFFALARGLDRLLGTGEAPA